MSTIYYKHNRLKTLRAFCETVRTGSISQAAKKLFSSQPAITLQIQALERELEANLFERHGPRLKLTGEGEILYDLAQPLVQSVDRLHETFHAHCGNLTAGELTIAAGESTILYILPEPIKEFTKQYPSIRLRLANVTGRDGLAMLRADEADFAVGSMLEIDDDISYEPVVSHSPVLITEKNHPLSKMNPLKLSDISPHGLILPPSHLSTWRIVKMVFAQNNISYRIALEAGGWEVIKRYVGLGLGISIVTDVCLTDKDHEIFNIMPLNDFFPTRSYGFVTRKGKFLSAPAKRFIEMMKQYYSIENNSHSLSNP